MPNASPKQVLGSWVYSSPREQPKAVNYGTGIRNRPFQHLRRPFLPGTLNNVPCCLNELLVNFERNLVGLAEFAGSNSNGRPTGPVSITVGQVAQFRSISSKIGQWAIRWNSSLQNRPIPPDFSRKLTYIYSKLGQLVIRWDSSLQRSANPTT